MPELKGKKYPYTAKGKKKYEEDKKKEQTKKMTQKKNATRRS
jgi:hypothetical protein